MKYFLMVLLSVFVVSCGNNNNDCPTNGGVNTTNPNCPNYSPYGQQYNQYPNNQYPNTQYPNNQYPNNQYQYGQPCQVGTPNCVNGYYYPSQYPNQYPNQYPYQYPTQYPYGYYPYGYTYR